MRVRHFPAPNDVGNARESVIQCLVRPILHVSTGLRGAVRALRKEPYGQLVVAMFVSPIIVNARCHAYINIAGA
jgi:hypothetical protein